MLALISQTLRGLVDLAFPPCCAACGRFDGIADPLCEGCAAKLLAQVAHNYCPRCGSTLGEGLTSDITGCWQCPDPLPRFERLMRVGPYKSPLADVVRGQKFRRAHGSTGWMADLLAQRIAADATLANIELIQPVPLHWRRQWSRGYNQAGLIAAALAGKLHVPLGDELLACATRGRRPISRVRGGWKMYTTPLMSPIAARNGSMANTCSWWMMSPPPAPRPTMRRGAIGRRREQGQPGGCGEGRPAEAIYAVTLNN